MEVRPRQVSEEIGKEEHRPRMEVHVLTNIVQRKSTSIELLTVPVGYRKRNMVSKYSFCTVLCLQSRTISSSLGCFAGNFLGVVSCMMSHVEVKFW